MHEHCVHFTIPVQPLPKKRPRFNSTGKRKAYTDSRTLAYEQTVATHAMIAMQSKDVLQGDLQVVLHFHRKGKKRADLDNLIKAVWDGMNGIVYEDDKQIVKATTQVSYGAEEPSVTITVATLPLAKSHE
jgi:Holliday junction resolvase RusA-like endonuclease